MSEVDCTTALFDVERARRETPGANVRMHFNNAGSSLMPQPVLDAVVGHLQLEAQIGGYEAAAQAGAAVEHVYDAVASLINCHRDEVAIIENATRAWDMAFYGMRFQPGDRILTGWNEYPSNYIAFLQMKKRCGVGIEIVPNDKHGQLDVNALKDMIDERVKLIAITHIPTHGGLVNPACEVGKVARAAGIPYLLDACQSVGQLVVDVEEIGCDILATTGRKFLRGPRGTGFLYVRKNYLENLEPPLLDQHAADWINREEYILRPDARRFENWETYHGGKIGLGVAIDYALGWGLAAIDERVSLLAERLRATLSAVPGVKLQDLGLRKCGIVTFTVEGISSGAIKEKLTQRNINVSVSQSGYSHLDMAERALPDLTRASVHYYNTEAEVERFGRELWAVIREAS